MKLFKQHPFFIFLSLLAWSLLSCVNGAAAAEESTPDDCPVAAEANRGHSLMQRSYRFGITEDGFDVAPQHPTDSIAPSPAEEEAQLFQLSKIGAGEVSVDVEQLAQWDAEVERLAEHLEQRRAELKKLHAQIDQPYSLTLAGGKNSFINSSGIDEEFHKEQLIVPVPYYMHKKKSKAELGQTPIETVTEWYGDIIGDALEPAKHEVPGSTEAKHAEHSHGHVVILFLFGALVLGSCLQLLLDRFAPSIPYTCILFVAGCFISWIHYMNRHGRNWTSWYNAVDMMQAINPHLMFYIFLPALIFGDVMKLKVQLVAACSKQVFVLACPGVLMGMCLTAVFARYMLPYGWDWSVCFVFGSILSATDPVAVVSLFNSLGVSPRLTMLISGESLVNDGTAIVCFALALKVAQGATLQPASAAYFFCYMIFPAILIGMSIGFVSVALISCCAEVVGESDAMIQVIITICCGYLAFFVAENEFSSSGVVATVSAGLAVAHSAWPLFVSRETVHTVWEAIEFVGNTVIFFLAGLIFMGIVLERNFGVEDFSWLLLLYLGMFLIRAFMLAFFWLPLNKAGQQIQWQEGVVMWWTGLRGAVSLAMGMIVDIETGIDKQVGSQVMFLVGGVAALTLLINSVTTGPLLRYLGLVKPVATMNRVSAKLSISITEDVKKTFALEINNKRDVRFYGANADLVRSMVPSLQEQEAIVVDDLQEDSSKEDTPADVPPATGVVRQQFNFHNQPIQAAVATPRNLERRLLQVFREVFLRVLQSRYWEGIEHGVIPRQLMVSRVLLHSTEEALDDTNEMLKDWDIIAKKMGPPSTGRPSRTERLLANLDGYLVLCWPLKLIPQLRKASLDFQSMMTVFVALSYIEAHTFAQGEIPLSLGRDDALSVRVQLQVMRESNLQCQKALDFIAALPVEFVELGKSEMLARRLLHQEITAIEHKYEAGFLSKQEKDHLCESGQDALREMASLPLCWSDHLASKDLSPKSEADSEGSESSPPPLQDRSQAPIVQAARTGFSIPIQQARDPRPPPNISHLPDSGRG